MDGTIRRLTEIVEYTMERHRVLLGNLANSDTPNYRAKDLRFRTVFDEELLRMRRTSPLHIRALEAGGRMVATERNGAGWLDGNDVEEDVEMARITENSILYQTAIRLLNGRFKMYRNLLTGR